MIIKIGKYKEDNIELEDVFKKDPKYVQWLINPVLKDGTTFKIFQKGLQDEARKLCLGGEELVNFDEIKDNSEVGTPLETVLEGEGFTKERVLELLHEITDKIARM